jgi:UDP-N-acetylmuramate: L-alanyl-gamma-D-glutamyl-meso-diaminopimelate ligase
MTSPRARRLPSLPPLATVRNVHIIGICGTAMGTLGAMLAEKGLRVSGSDAMAYPPMSDWLRERGLVVQSGYDPAHIPGDTDLVVVGNIARRDNPESVAAHDRGLPCISLPEALRVFFLAHQKGLVVTGTHGKTTTTALATWLLHEAGRDPGMFVGGVTANFDASYRIGRGEVMVVEGDEYDTAWFDKVPKFWHYPAFSATVNNVEFDHADIYPDIRSIERVFLKFADSVDPRGQLWVNGDDERALKVTRQTWATRRTFGLGDHNDLRATIRHTDSRGTLIQVTLDGTSLGDCQLSTLGAHNVRNFLGAAGLISSVGVSVQQSLPHAETFRGVRKRQEVRGEAQGVIVIDDLAHHPTAVRETLAALRARWPESRLWAIFEAKSNTSRRSVFQQDYVEAFEHADIVILSQPWKQDNLPDDQKLNLDRLVSDMRAAGKVVELIPQVSDIVQHVATMARPGDVVAGLSGSSFGGLHDAILAALRKS